MVDVTDVLLLCMQDEVLIAGFGRRGHAVGDIPGVRFKVGLIHSFPFVFWDFLLLSSFPCLQGL